MPKVVAMEARGPTAPVASCKMMSCGVIVCVLLFLGVSHTFVEQIWGPKLII